MLNHTFNFFFLFLYVDMYLGFVTFFKLPVKVKKIAKNHLNLVKNKSGKVP